MRHEMAGATQGRTKWSAALS
ncbi:hypothetical protein IL54_0121 [Sphingobium sp. ba1]|nr:hypothetical protein IL54_0121 [Sphingobium sp. ba1]